MKIKWFILPLIVFIINACGKAEEKQTVAENTTENIEVQHPMDGLTKEELLQAIEVLKQSGHYDSLTRIPELKLKEPIKQSIYSWKKGDPISRKADAVIRQGHSTYEAEIDITSSKLISWKHIKDVQPSIMLQDFMLALEVWKESPIVVNELKRRGYNLDSIYVAPLSSGYFGPDEGRDKRLLKVWLQDRSGSKTNLYAKPIEGIVPVVDIDKKKVVEVYIDENVGRNDINYDYDGPSNNAKKPKPIVQHAPEGNNFTIDGGIIKWDDWKFHLRFDKRVGSIISLAEFNGQSVAYQVSPNEMFVPYMDSNPGWYYRSYMDIGEYGFGLLSSPLEKGTDVPAYATLLNGYIPADDGMPMLYENVIGVFERNTGKPLWRHAEFMENHESRMEVELVVRTIPVVGNYDYIVDYVFSSKGLLKVEVGATGMDAVKAVKAQKMDDPTAIMETKAGNLVAPNLVGVSHDHYLSFRVDVDVDGIDNTFVTDEVVPVGYQNSPRLSGWEVVEHPELKEGPVSEDDVEHEGYWRVVNKNSKNGLGQYKGYQLLGHTSVSLLNPEDLPQQRAKWSQYPMWITPYNANEQYPSGKYPNQSDGTKGLAQWTTQERSIDNTDIVCWYTMGFHHISRPEDWPVLPTVWHTMTLRPFHSFDKSPAIDIAK